MPVYGVYEKVSGSCVPISTQWATNVGTLILDDFKTIDCFIDIEKVTNKTSLTRIEVVGLGHLDPSASVLLQLGDGLATLADDGAGHHGRHQHLEVVCRLHGCRAYSCMVRRAHTKHYILSTVFRYKQSIKTNSIVLRSYYRYRKAITEKS